MDLKQAYEQTLKECPQNDLSDFFARKSKRLYTEMQVAKNSMKLNMVAGDVSEFIHAQSKYQAIYKQACEQGYSLSQQKQKNYNSELDTKQQSLRYVQYLLKQTQTNMETYVEQQLERIENLKEQVRTTEIDIENYKKECAINE